MNKILKIILIIFLIIILFVVLFFGILYYNSEKTKKNIAKWTYCEVDEDCILVNSSSSCACGSFSVNKIYKDEYTKFMNKVVAKRKSSMFQMMCNTCLLPTNEVAKCIKNKCYAFSDNSHELKLLNMT